MPHQLRGVPRLNPHQGGISMRLASAVGLVLLSSGCAQDKREIQVPKSNGTASVSPQCPSTGAGEVYDIAVAKCLANPLAAKSVAQRSAPKVVLYLDRSASMRGFLDPEYPTRVKTDFRSVIDRLLVGTNTVRAYSYGSSIRRFQPTLGVLGNKEFYSDRDTRLEDALAIIARDSLGLETHVIVGDARRGSPDRANAQFTDLRTMADAWVDHGGTFITAVSLAPFKTVASDPSGCRTVPGDVAGSQTCPLYAFAFVAAQDVDAVTTAIADVFENIFAWPVPVIPTAALTEEQQGSSPDISLEKKWAPLPDGGWIGRTRGRATTASNRELFTQLAAGDSLNPSGRTYAALLSGQEQAVSLRAKSLSSSTSSPWVDVAPRGALVRMTKDKPPTLGFVTRGVDAPRSIIAVDLLPRGVPSWLESVSAADANDVRRTFGIGLLFEAFRTKADRSPAPAARYFFVAN